MAYTYGLGPWIADESRRGWIPPAKCCGLDLGTAADAATLPSMTTARRVGFFWGPDWEPPAEYVRLGQGDCRDLPADDWMKDAWRVQTKYRPDGARLVDLLADHLTTGADPNGKQQPSPLEPTFDLCLEINLPGHSRVWEQPFVWGAHKHTNRLRDALRAAFQKQWEKDANQSRRALDWLAREKYRGVDWREFVPPGLLKDVPGPLPHQTTLTEDFTGGDKAGVGYVYTWGEVRSTADFSNTGNACKALNTGNYNAATVRCESDLSGTDHWFESTISTITIAPNPWNVPMALVCGRFSSSANSCYQFGHEGQSSAYVRLYKLSAGTPTSLGSSSVGSTYASGTAERITCNGSSLTGAWAGANKVTVTDTTFGSGTRGGLAGALTSASAGLRWTPWSGADLETFSPAVHAARRRRRIAVVVPELDW